jgi:hypothetical protein
MSRVPGIGLLFDAAVVLKGTDRKIMKILDKAAESNYDSNRMFYVIHSRILIFNKRN